jgi:hypothetical protein
MKKLDSYVGLLTQKYNSLGIWTAMQMLERAME